MSVTDALLYSIQTITVTHTQGSYVVVEESLINGMDPLLPLSPFSPKDFQSAGEGDVLWHLPKRRPLEAEHTSTENQL